MKFDKTAEQIEYLSMYFAQVREQKRRVGDMFETLSTYAHPDDSVCKKIIDIQKLLSNVSAKFDTILSEVILMLKEEENIINALERVQMQTKEQKNGN